jgi:aspartate carbamoyltransferase
MKHILTVDQFTPDDIRETFELARKLELQNPVLNMLLKGKTLACVFYEPSTRTSASFVAAMTKLGGGVIPITEGVQFSSAAKGESVEDTITTLGQYADVIVLRHPKTGAVKKAAETSPVPIINAGDGDGEHPTQALIDLYTIFREFSRLDGLKVTFIGDLAYSRTIHSLAKLLYRYKVRFNLISPRLLSLHRCTENFGIEDKIDREVYVETGLHEAREALLESDVLYVTRVQKERFTYNEGYRDVKDSCLLTPELVAELKETARILHPLPRVNEIPKEIDSDPRAAYFRGVRYGLFVRMALLVQLLTG